MKFTGNSLLRIFFPPRCMFCDGALLSKETYLCKKCESKLRKIEGPRCITCGRPLEGSGFCEDCSRIHHNFISGRYSLSYASIQESIYRFKYMNRPEYAKAYAHYTYEYLKDWLEDIDAKALVPVPLHQRKFEKRGYNQAEEFARELSRLTGIPLRSDLCSRVKNTVPQKEFDREDRQKNMKNAFFVNRNVVELKSIVLVDDIYTTGSTIDSLAGEFLSAGVERIFFVSITAGNT